MRDLMAAVGEVLLCWGYVEAAILDRLAAIGEYTTMPLKTSPLARWKKAERATDRIAELQAAIERLADIRNALAHGLASATVGPNGKGGAAVVCRTSSGDQRIEFETLMETGRLLFRASHAVRALR